MTSPDTSPNTSPPAMPPSPSVPSSVSPPANRPSVLASGLSCRCPRCGEGKLFDGFLKLRPSCTACGLDLAFADSADGPAVLIMFLVGFGVVGLALWLEITYEPPLWLHLVLWLPLVILSSLVLLRPLKALAVAIQYANDAGEGRQGP